MLAAVSIILVFSQCKKISDDTEVEPTETVLVNNSVDELNSRVTYFQDAVFSTRGGKSKSNNYYWYYVAEVAAPIFNGNLLSASHVDIIDNKAYVAYNVQGSTYAGGIEVIDLSNPAYPTIITQILFNGSDANAVAADIDGSNSSRDVYLALSSFKKGALLRKLSTNNGQFTGGFYDLSLSKYLSGSNISASANGISCTNDYLYVTSGQTYGGVFQVSKDNFTVTNADPYSAAKYTVTNGATVGSKQVTLSTGDQSKLHVYEVGNSLNKQTRDIGTITHQNVDEPYFGKSAMHMDNGSNICYVAMGMYGAKAFDINSGNVVFNSPSNMLTTGNTNGLSKDDLFIYLANGADGLFVGKNPSGSGEIIPVQVWDMDEIAASANLVMAANDWLFVAKGGGGFKILKRVHQSIYPPVCDYDNTGLPECLEEFEFCAELPAHMDITLPERVNAFVNRPDYFLNQNLEVELEENAHLSIVFISEGAAFHNTFGYYYYPTNNPPSSLEDIQSTMHIVYPDASEIYSGGYLQAGDMVRIPDEFSAGTTVGFFMLANAFKDGEVTEGLYQHYTRREFNYRGLQQHLLMYDSICGCVTIGIEDLLSDRGDKDFNDIVFQVLIEPETAFNKEMIVQIPPQ